MYKRLAQGGVGLIITGFAYPQLTGRAGSNQTGVHNDGLISCLKTLSKTVHLFGEGCKIALQIGHCGRQSKHLLETIAPSAILEKISKKIPRKSILNIPLFIIYEYKYTSEVSEIFSAFWLEFRKSI